MATNLDMTFHLSGGAGNTDPNASLGGARSTAGGGALHDVESTFTSTGSAGAFEVFDSALGGSDGDHVGKYLLVVDGASELHAGRILRYRASDGRFFLDEPLAVALGIGDTYRLFPKNNLFDDVTPTQSAFGTPEYRGIYLLNNNGTDTYSPQSMWIRRLDDGPIGLEIFADDNNSGQPTLPAFSDSEVGPSAGQLSAVNLNGRFSSPLTFSIGQLGSPNVTGPRNLGSNAHRGIYVRRLVPSDQQARASVAFLIIGEGTFSGQKRSGAIVHFDVDGFTLDTAGVKFDRTVKINGGARVDVTVRSVEKGTTVEGVAVSYRHSLGPGTLTVGDFTETDARGKSFAAYTAPTDQADAGLTVEVEVRV